MTPGRIGLAIAAVAVAFGVAFGIGKATAPEGEEAAAPEPARTIEVSNDAGEIATLEPAGSLPGLRREPESGGGGGGGEPAAPSGPSEPSTPSPSPAPAPAPAPAPSPAPSPGGDGGGGGGGGGFEE